MRHDASPDDHWIRSETGGNLKLAFMDLLCQFNSRNYSTCIVEALETHHRSQTGLHPSMILFHDVVQVLTTANLDRIRSAEVKLLSHSHASQCRVTGFMSVQRDAVRMRPIFQCLAKESLGCRYTPSSAEIELDRVSLTIHGPV